MAENREAGASLLSLTRLFRFRVKVQRSRAPGALPQCYRCQRSGHHSDTCSNAPACVRCSLPHASKLCDPPAFKRCINCGGSHPANYRACPVFQQELERRKPKGRLPPPRHPVAGSRPATEQPGPAPPATAAVSFAAVANLSLIHI